MRAWAGRGGGEGGWTDVAMGRATKPYCVEARQRWPLGSKGLEERKAIFFGGRWKSMILTNFFFNRFLSFTSPTHPFSSPHRLPRTARTR